MSRPGSPQVTAIDLNFNQRQLVNLRAENVSYIVNPKKLPCIQRLGNLQLPWEWNENNQPQASAGECVICCAQRTDVGDSGHFRGNFFQFRFEIPILEIWVPDELNSVPRRLGWSLLSLQKLTFAARSGKTSLLDVLAGRNDGGVVEGQVYLNNVPWTNQMIRTCGAYVRQDDRLLAHLTVKETLMFVAQLKLPTSFTRRQTESRVDEVIAELGLRHVSDTKVGNEESRGVSGGERRRVSIGIQLLLDPSIIFLDEPTSGLDAFTAHHLVETLSKLAKNNRTVLMSIHQPRSDIFDLFDLVMILSRGQMVYFGKASNMVQYFTGIGFPCPILTNPCDFYVDLATIDPTSEESERSSQDTVQTLLTKYEETHSTTSDKPSSTDQDSLEEHFPVMSMSDIRDYSPGPLRQFAILFSRCTRNLVEDYLFLAAQFIQALSMSLVVGFIYYKLGTEQSTIRDWFGLMYIIGAMYPYLVILDLVSQYHNERNYLYYELQDRLYGICPYYFAKICSEIPFHTFFVITYVIPVYFLAGFTVDVWVFFRVFAVTYVLVYCSRSLAMFSASVTPTFTMSCFLAQTFFSMYLMSAGFFINLKNIFSGLSWVSDVSYLKWGFQGLCLAEIAGLNFTGCPPGIPGCIQTGADALKLYSLNYSTVLNACLYMSASIGVFMFLYFLALRTLRIMEDSADEDLRRHLVSEEHLKYLDETIEVVIWFRDREGIHVTLDCGGQEATAEDLFDIALEQKRLPAGSEQYFSIWLCSPMLELRLKKHHKPFHFAQMWDELCALYTDEKVDEIARDEPVVMLQRNVFLPLEDEMKIANDSVLSLLYHEAKYNVIEGRYVMSDEDYDRLAGIQALIHMEQYDPTKHTLAAYRKELEKFYPEHLRKVKSGPIIKLRNPPREENLDSRLSQAHRQKSQAYKDVSVEKCLPELYREYLDICWQYPFYGSAFFEAVVQKNCGKIKGYLPGVTKEIEVWVAINTDGVCILDKHKEESMLAVPYEELSWDLDPNIDEDEERDPSLLLQFLHNDPEGEGKCTKLLQVYSRQAKMMDALIDSCVKRKLQKSDVSEESHDVVEGGKCYKNSMCLI
ncbi:hypothetical protein FSP39_017341 [Pinctada imbricata]|uniref:ABC transporter domain-containing protein n=1 Tax=Pinctada imbricata TaxID=66713 RepID=A0AA89BWQ5_PINIB|nr:hypothetical protein FSP39_017341 [Pinctada imbricata]